MSKEIQPAEMQGLINALSLDLEGAKRHYEMFNKFKKNICVANIDYGKIPGTDKPTLLQPGAQKLSKAFHLTTSLETTTREIDHATGFVCYEYKCTVYNTMGLPIGHGIGSCNSFEDKYCFSGWQKDANKPDDAIQVKMKADGTGSFRKDFQSGTWVWNIRSRKRNQELIALQNTIMKMAAKRAFVHAVLTATGGGEFFTQDIEDMPEIADNGARIDEIKAALIWAINNTVGFANELETVWKNCQSLHRDKDFVNAVIERKKAITVKPAE